MHKSRHSPKRPDRGSVGKAFRGDFKKKGGLRQNFCELIYLADRRVRQTTKGRLTDRQVGRYRTRQTGRQIENCLSYLRWCSLATPQAQAQSPAITKSMHNATCLWVFVHSHSQNNKTNYTRPAFPSLTI